MATGMAIITVAGPDRSTATVGSQTDRRLLYHGDADARGHVDADVHVTSRRAKRDNLSDPRFTSPPAMKITPFL